MSNPPRWFPALAAGIALAIVAAASWPVAIAPSAWVIGAGDNDFASIAWSLHHAAWCAVHGRLPIGQTERLMYPTGASIAVAALPEGLLLAPVTRIAGATVTFNVVQAAHVALAAAAGAWCAARIGADRAGAALLAVACGACPALLGALYNQNPDVTAMFGVPLVYGLARERPGAAGLVAGAIAWCNPYCGVMAGLAGLAAAPRYRPAARLVAGAAVLGLPYAASILLTAGSGGAVHRWVGGVVATPPWALLWPRPPAGKLVDTAYVGISLVALAAWGARARRLPGLGVMLAAGVVLALGPRLGVVPLPGMILEWTPIGALRIASRFSMLVVFALGAQAALAISGSKWRWIAVLVVAADLLLLADGGRRLAGRRTPLRDACAAVRVVDGPVAYVPSEATDRGLYLGTCHDQPVADGLKGQISQASRRAQRGPPQRLAAALRHDGIAWVILDERADGRWRGLLEPCTKARGGGVRVVDLRCAAP